MFQTMMKTNQTVRLVRMKMLACLTAGIVLSLNVATADPVVADSGDAKDMKELTPPPSGEKDWTLELGSGALWSNVRTSDDKAYAIIPISLTASLKLDDVGLDHELGGVPANGEEIRRSNRVAAPRPAFRRGHR